MHWLHFSNVRFAFVYQVTLSRRLLPYLTCTPRYCFAKDLGWKDQHFELPLVLWDVARKQLIEEDGVEPHITAWHLVGSAVRLTLIMLYFS